MLPPGGKLRHARKPRVAGPSAAPRQRFAQRFHLARSQDHVRRHRKVEEIPLRHAFGGLLPSKRNLHKRNIAFIAFRSDLIAEHRAHQFQRLRFLPYPKKINLLCRIQRRACLHRREFSAQQPKRVRNWHSQFLLRHCVNQIDVALLSLRKRRAGHALHRVVDALEIQLRGRIRNRVRRRKRQRSGRTLSRGPNVKRRSGNRLAQNRGLHVRFRSLERDVPADRVHRVQPRRVQQRPHLEHSRFRIIRKIFQVGNPQKKFQQAAAQIRLRFLVRRRLRQRRPARSHFAVQPAQQIFHHKFFASAHRILSMLRPVRRAALAFHFEDLHACDCHLRQSRRFLLFRAHPQDRFRQQHFFPRAVIHKKHAVPRRRLRVCHRSSGRKISPRRLAPISQREGIFQQPCKLLHLLRCQFWLRRFFVRRAEHACRHRRTHRRKIRVVPQRQQRVRLSNLRRRNAAPDHVEHRARRHLRRLQRSLRARHVRHAHRRERGNE